MKNWWIGGLLALAVCLPTFSQAKDADYKAGKIVTVDKLPSAPSTGGTDAALRPDVHTYNVSIQVGDTIYVCRYQSDSGDLSWLDGKDVQVRMKGKKMYVKRASGSDAQASILKTKKAEMP